MITIRTILAAFTSVALLVEPSSAHSIKRNPVESVSVIENASIETRTHVVHSHSKFDLHFTLHNGQQHVRLSLEPNHDILHESFAVTYLGADGQVKGVKSVDRKEHKVYRGDSYVQREGTEGWSKAGWARITVHRDGNSPLFDGVFRLDGDNHNIQIGKTYRKVKNDEDPDIDDDEAMVVWRDSDIRSSFTGHDELKRRDTSNDSLCSADSLDFNTKFDQELKRSTSLMGIDSRSLFGRQSIDGGGSGNDAAGMNLISSIGSVSGCPTTRKVALVGIATDCTYWDGFDKEEDLRKNVISMVNQASEVYEKTFQISLGIRNLTVSEKGCPGTPSDAAPWNVDCGNGVTIENRLSLFSAWRGQFADMNAYWSLLTRCPTENAVGLAWRSQLCRQGSSKNGDSNETIAAANVVVRTSTEWQIFAHESGHTFGAVHDCMSQTCPVSQDTQSCCPLSRSTCDADGKFIMNPSTAPDISTFSPCSIGNICSGLKGHVNGDCLVDNRNVDTFSESQCGNGIVETGEDCDCGGDQACQQNSCCNPDTCKYMPGAVCDPTNEDCCTDKCQFASAGTVCRSSTGQCDLEETCAGNTSTCPTDQHKNDGDSCGAGNGLQCAAGQCTSRDLQCQTLVGGLNTGNKTKSCGRSCLLSCESPDYGGQCVMYNQNFLDGSPCGAGGHCNNGDCKGSSTLKEITQWIDDHKTIFIPVVSVIGLLILIAIISCISNCIKRRVRRKRAPKMPQNQAWPGHPGPWPNQNNPSQPMTSNPYPIPPPPDYQYSQQQYYNRSRTMRYA